MEKKHTLNTEYAVRLMEEHIFDMLKKFDWKIYNELIYKLRKSCDVFEDKPQEEMVNSISTSWCHTDSFGKYILVKNKNRDYKNILIKFSMQMKAVADANPMQRIIRFNTKNFIGNIYYYLSQDIKSNEKTNFDVINFLFHKVFFHELMHLEGNISRSPNTPYPTALNEAVTELLSVKLMYNYFIRSSGKASTDIFVRYFRDSLFMYYRDEVQILRWIYIFISKATEVDQNVVMRSFFKAYFHDEQLQSTEFKSLIPKDLEKIWNIFFNLDMNSKKYGSDKQKISNEIKGLKKKFDMN